MPLRAHEAYELNHLLMGCVTTINNMGVFFAPSEGSRVEVTAEQTVGRPPAGLQHQSPVGKTRVVE